MSYRVGATLILLAGTATADPGARAVDAYINCLRDAFTARIASDTQVKEAIESESFADCSGARRLVASTVPATHVDSVLAQVDDFMRQSLNKRMDLAAEEAEPETP